MRLLKIQTDLVKPRQDIIKIILSKLRESNVMIEDDDILAVTSKVVSLSQGRLVHVDRIKPSNHVLNLAKRYNLDPKYVELILKEADEFYGGTDQALCTVKDGLMIANAGVDRKNVPPGYAVLFPKKPNRVAEHARRRIYRLTGKFVGVLIVDSRVTPLRLGTVGVAVGFAGFSPVRDCRGSIDLYGKPLQITRHCRVDDLAGAAHLLMGEVDERVIAVLIRGAPIKIVHRLRPPLQQNSVKVSKNRCLFINALRYGSRSQR
ncbi:MAG: coenzyme F420-0:L-glutamate ligase [Candidatus Bathyarchaeia archaeon]